MNFNPIRFFTRDARLGIRLAVAVAFPLLAVAALATSLVSIERDIATSMGQFRDVTKISVQIGNLVHELQKERGMSAVFLNSGGQQMGGEIPGQRNLTSERIAALDESLKQFDLKAQSAGVQRMIDGGLTALKQLNATRDEISAQRIKGPESNAFFTATIARFLNVLREVAKDSRDPEVTAAFNSYYSYTMAKEKAGQERATGAVGFAAGQFTIPQFSAFAGIGAEQLSLVANFEAFATPEQKDFASRTVQGAAVTDVDRMRGIAMKTGAANKLEGASGTDWFKATTARIDIMKIVENRLAEDLGRSTGVKSDGAYRSFLEILIVSIATLFFSTLLAWWLARSITRPVKAMTDAMRKLASGDTQTVIPATDNKDEIGTMAGAVQVFKDNMIEADRLRSDQEEQKKRAEIEKKAAMNKMADEFESSVKGVVQIVSSASTELQSTAQSMSATAEETQRQSTAVAAASEQASTNVQTVASAAEELSSSITEISRQVTESTRISGQAVADAERTNTEIQGLSEAAQKIGDVVKLINDIAGQTNLLALNATIEAARAGEAGKGFAVVASEVKNLASQTAKATEEISSKIAEMQAATGRSVTAVQGIGQTIGRINEIATTIASAVEEQGAATQEIARNVQQASAGTAEVSSNIVGVTKAANDTGAASTQVLGSAGELSKQSETLRQQVEGFIARIRAA